jgi:hypothetical protein
MIAAIYTDSTKCLGSSSERTRSIRGSRRDRVSTKGRRSGGRETLRLGPQKASGSFRQIVTTPRSAEPKSRQKNTCSKPKCFESRSEADLSAERSPWSFACLDRESEHWVQEEKHETGFLTDDVGARHANGCATSEPVKPEGVDASNVDDDELPDES